MRVLLLFSMVVVGCKQPAPSPPFHPGRAVYDTTPISVTNFLRDPAIRQKILGMSFGEAAARLGPLRFVSQSQFIFSRGGDDYDQQDRYEAAQDEAGNFDVHLETPEGQQTVRLVGENLYVRQGTGHMRKKPRRDVDAEAWTELAFVSMRQTLEVFRPYLALADESPDTVSGRGALRYKLALTDVPNDVVPQLPDTASLPHAAPSRWRELKKPLGVSGALWIDTATGVPLQLKLEGRLEIADRDLRPTQLRISYQGQIKEIGAVRTISAPADAVPEYERDVPPRDLLSFFRDQVPLPSPTPDDPQTPPDTEPEPTP